MDDAPPPPFIQRTKTVRRPMKEKSRKRPSTSQSSQPSEKGTSRQHPRSHSSNPPAKKISKHPPTLHSSNPSEKSFRELQTIHHLERCKSVIARGWETPIILLSHSRWVRDGFAGMLQAQQRMLTACESGTLKLPGVEMLAIEPKYQYTVRFGDTVRFCRILEAVHVRFPYFKLSGVNGPDDKGVFWLGFYEVKTFPFDPSKAAFSDLAVQICGAAKAARLRYILWITINEDFDRNLGRLPPPPASEHAIYPIDPRTASGLKSVRLEQYRSTAPEGTWTATSTSTFRKSR